MDPCMYLFINSGLDMSPGKLGAQAGHAAVEAYRRSVEPDSGATRGGIESTHNLIRHWYKGGHYKKIVLDGRDSVTMLTIDRYLRDRHFKTALIVDEGRTEIAPITPTALGVAVVDKDDPHVEATFSTFDLLRPRKVEPHKQPRRFLWLLRFSMGKSNDTKDPSPES